MADGSWYDADIDHVIISEEQIREKIDELAKQVAADHADDDRRHSLGHRDQAKHGLAVLEQVENARSARPYWNFEFAGLDRIG